MPQALPCGVRNKLHTLRNGPRIKSGATSGGMRFRMTYSAATKTSIDSNRSRNCAGGM
jgi:hypothetical protein